MKYDVFISSSAQDRDWVRALAAALKASGLSVWHHETKIKPGDLLLKRLREGLESSRNVVFVLDEKASKSNWVLFELGATLGLRKPIIPVVREGVSLGELPGPIRIRRHITGRDPAATAKEIVQAITMEQDEHENTTA